MKNDFIKLSQNPNFANVRKWAQERKIIVAGNEITQALKLFEEFGELTGSVLKNKTDVVKDSVGDMIVVLINLNAINKINIESAIDLLDPIDAKFFRNEKLVTMGVGHLCFDLASSYEDRNQILDLSLAMIRMLHLLCTFYNFTVEECFNSAWEEIKDRTGKNVDGNFIKD